MEPETTLACLAIYVVNRTRANAHARGSTTSLKSWPPTVPRCFHRRLQGVSYALLTHMGSGCSHRAGSARPGTQAGAGCHARLLYAQVVKPCRRRRLVRVRHRVVFGSLEASIMSWPARGWAPQHAFGGGDQPQLRSMSPRSGENGSALCQGLRRVVASFWPCIRSNYNFCFLMPAYVSSPTA